MTLAELNTLLMGTGLPVAYYAFPEGEAPDLPFICYLSTGSNNKAADGKVYFSATRIQVELYTETKSPGTEALVENALSGMYWEKTESYISGENCWMILYEIEV